MSEALKIDAEETPVDDVRRVRERLSKEAGGDVRKYIQQSNQIFEELKSKLKLRVKEEK